MWIRTVDILKSAEMNGEVVQYIHSRRCIDIMVQSWKECLIKNNLTLVDYREINLGLTWLYNMLYNSAKIQFNGFFEEMNTMEGYNVISKILKTGPFHETALDAKVCVCDTIKKRILETH